MRWVYLGLGMAALLYVACSGKVDLPAAASLPSEVETVARLEQGLPWSADLLERYVCYQREAAKAFQRTSAAESIAGRGVESDLGAALRVQGEALEQARSRSGLSEADLEQLDQVVDQFLSLRDRLSELPSAGEVEKVKLKTGRLPESVRQKIERMLQRVEAERRESEELGALKAQQGEAVVELLLSRESELRAIRRKIVNELLAR